MSEIKPVPVERFDMDYSFYGQPEMQPSENGDYVEFAAYEALENERDELKQSLDDLQERFNGIKFIESELRKENEAQAKRIAELEEHVTKLGSGSRQHLYKAFACRYKEILSLRKENEVLRKQVEGIAKGIQKHFELSDSDLAILMSNFENGDSK